MDKIYIQLIRLLTDMQFSYPLFVAQKFFSPTQNATSVKSFHETTVEMYTMKFGNAFPGPNFGIAHHCVDLIYIFDAFHEYITQADEEEAKDASSTATSSDSGYQSSNSPSSESQEKELRSNLELRKEIQQKWIDFIVGGKSDAVKTAPEGSVLVYGTDRISRVLSTHEDASLKAQRDCFELIERHYGEMQTVTNPIVHAKVF